MSVVQVCTVDPGVGVACPSGSVAWVDLNTLWTPADLNVGAVDIAYVFGWGFAAVVFCWWLGYVIGVALLAIRKA